MTGPNRPTDTDSTSTVGRLARRLGLGREEYGEGGRDSYYGDDRPIFVLGCCQRTGTSLLQRLITSMPGVFIWGETNGEMGAILRSRQRAVDRSIEVAETRNHIRRAGLLAFMADASPEQQQVDNAYRSYIREMYRYDHTGTPLSRWGYTEFRHDARELAYLLDLFPNAKAVVINRDLGQVAESILRYEFDPAIQWSRQWTLDALDMWRENTFEMPALPSSLVLRINYSNLVQNSEQTLRTIEEHLAAPPGSINREVLQIRVQPSGEFGTPSVRPTITTIPAPVAQFLADEQTKSAMEAFERYW